MKEHPKKKFDNNERQQQRQFIQLSLYSLCQLPLPHSPNLASWKGGRDLFLCLIISTRVTEKMLDDSLLILFVCALGKNSFRTGSSRSTGGHFNAILCVCVLPLVLFM